MALCKTRGVQKLSGTVKQIWPYLLMAAAPALLLAGFLYDLVFAGIPYQDPTPEMAASYASHASIASMIYWSAALVFLAAVTAVVVRSRVRRKRRE
jgi:hypothetical protein